MKRMLCMVSCVLLLLGIPVTGSAQEEIQQIQLYSSQCDGVYTHGATLNDQAVPEYDYTWHADPSQDHGQVKNSPAEYYTGTAPTGEDPVYIAHDIYYYPMLEESKFRQVNYDGEMEWAYFYEAEGYENYIFSTLPSLRTGFPSHMMHTEAEAYENAVLYITQPGTYRLQGNWHGQVRIDLGDEDEVFRDPEKKVTLILDGVDITCTVAPGVVFASVYECDNGWEERESYSAQVDTSQAGANVVLADGSTNRVSGTNIFRILKTKYKEEISEDTYPAQKKQRKVDGAFYSYQSLHISGQSAGTGVLNITSGFEGLDSELHLTISGGHVNIYSQDDGINVNEDGVSVLTVSGGSLHICAGLGAEGDGIDSNGFLMIRGGTVISMANPAADSGLDSDCGSFVTGGTVVALGAAMDWAEAEAETASTQPVLNLQFTASQDASEAIVITDTAGNAVFAYDPDKDEVAGEYARTYRGAILSAPGLLTGGSYEIYIGGDVEGTEVSGVYDPDSIRSFQGGLKQCWSGNSLGGFGGGMGRPEDMPGMIPPEGMEPPQNSQRPEKPEGEVPGMQEGFQPGQRPEGGFQQPEQAGATCTAETVFSLDQQVNAFSSVADWSHTLKAVEETQATFGTSGTKAHYVCDGCEQLFLDAQGKTPVTRDELVIPAKSYGVLIAAGILLAVAVPAAGIYWLLKKKRK